LGDERGRVCALVQLLERVKSAFAVQRSGDPSSPHQFSPDCNAGLNVAISGHEPIARREDVEKVVRLTMRAGTTGTERLQRSGLSLSTVGGKVTVRFVSFGSEAAKYGLATGDEVIAVLVPADRPSRFWFVLPALLLLAVVVMRQRRRIQHLAKVAVAL
jgi:hypothetical protein